MRMHALRASASPRETSCPCRRPPRAMCRFRQHVPVHSAHNRHTEGAQGGSISRAANVGHRRHCLTRGCAHRPSIDGTGTKLALFGCKCAQAEYQITRGRRTGAAACVRNVAAPSSIECQGALPVGSLLYFTCRQGINAMPRGTP